MNKFQVLPNIKQFYIHDEIYGKCDLDKTTHKV